MSMLTDNLDSIADKVRSNISAKDAAREKVLPLCREIIRHSSDSIRAVHRQEFDKAQKSLKEARRLLDNVDQILSEDDLANNGFLRDAQKEFAEGRITLALVRGEPVPDPDELAVDYAAYLNGLGEAVGELRRYLLDSMRKGDLS